MLINSVASQLFTAPELTDSLRDMREGKDVSLSIAQSARPLAAASFWAREPRPCLLVVAGEEAADRMARSLAAWLGQEVVARFPERRDWPWSDRPADDAVVGARCQAIERLATGEPCLVVASARTLLRRVPPAGKGAKGKEACDTFGYWASATFAVGDEIDFEDVPRLLVAMGYADAGAADAPGSFRVHGDTVDVYPAQATAPVRLEFFGDEIDRIRRMVASTGQTIGELEEVRIVPCREIALTDETIARATRSLSRKAMEDTALAADLELIKQRADAPQLDRYLPELYGGRTSSPMEHLSARTLVVLVEPRALFDDCLRAWDDITSAARLAHADVSGLFTPPKELDFGKQQRVTFSSIQRAGSARSAAHKGLLVKQPNIAGADSKLLGRLRHLVRDKSVIVFAVPDRAAREHLELHLSDEHIPFVE